jgi:predicted transglutaminase-like cysteine proteinase
MHFLRSREFPVGVFPLMHSQAHTGSGANKRRFNDLRRKCLWDWRMLRCGESRVRISSAIVLLPAILAVCSGPSLADLRQLYSKATPPIGFVEFCTRYHSECLPTRSAAKISLTKERWKNLLEVNALGNSNIEPRSDQELYGVPERWDYPIKAGDCEDYALLKKRYLEHLGFTAGSLLLAVGLDEAGQGHAVLMVLTDRGDFVLDNRRNKVLRWNQTRYHFLLRQSAEDPMTWIALSRMGVTSSVGASHVKRGNR